MPPVEGHIKQYNHEFESFEEELLFREELEANGGSVLVPYKYNRAVIFVSDQYHHSEDFHFSTDYDGRRINLTMLWGDRIQQGDVQSSQESTAAPDLNSSGEWDIFN